MWSDNPPFHVISFSSLYSVWYQTFTKLCAEIPLDNFPQMLIGCHLSPTFFVVLQICEPFKKLTSIHGSAILKVPQHNYHASSQSYLTTALFQIKSSNVWIHILPIFNAFLPSKFNFIVNIFAKWPSNIFTWLEHQWSLCKFLWKCFWGHAVCLLYCEAFNVGKMFRSYIFHSFLPLFQVVTVTIYQRAIGISTL